MTSGHSSSIDTALQRALALHRQGQFAAAEAQYRQVLAWQPRHFDALHLLGVLARQGGRPQAAIDLIGQALTVDATQAIAYCNLGAAWQDLNRPDEALRHYDRALQIKPDYALALNNRGNALRKLQRPHDALLSYQHALRVQPDYAEAFYNRGLVLQQLERLEDALSSYELAVRFKPDYADAWCNHGIALQMLQRHEPAMASYEQALRIAPQHANAHCNRGTLLRKLGRYEDALASYDSALQYKPAFADAHLFRGNALRALRRTGEAITAYRRALELGGDPETIHYALAALGAESAPDASPSDYVKNLFDQYADHFDRHLLDMLHYRTPHMLLDMLAATRRQYGLNEAGDTLDLGCGTGLCGPLLRPWSRTLSGVDLSPNMLEKARQRNVYDHLVCADLSDYLQDKDDCYDLVVAADVFVYIGDLSGVFSAVRGALCAGGLFAFSVEACEEQGEVGEGSEDFVLRASHRYAHSAAYLKKLAHDYCFSIEQTETRVLRHDDGVGINGYLVILRSAG